MYSFVERVRMYIWPIRFKILIVMRDSIRMQTVDSQVPMFQICSAFQLDL